MLEIKPEDLVEMCKECRGSGDRNNNNPRVLPHCGHIPIYPCDECKGKGYKELTSTGELLLEFTRWVNSANGPRPK